MANNAESAKLTTSQILIKERERIISLPFKDSMPEGTNFEVVDIVNDYPWILDNIHGRKNVVNISSIKTDSNGKTASSTLGGGYIKRTKTPVCYMVERKNAVNGSITAVLGMLGALDQIANGIQEAGQNIKTATSNSNAAMKGIGAGVSMITDIGGDLIHGFKNLMSKIVGKTLEKVKVLSTTNNLNDEIFNPYRLLYITEDTKKRYVFPLTNTDAASFLPTKLQWTDVKIMDGKNALGKLINSVIDSLTSGAQLTNMMNNATRLTDASLSADDMGFVNEAAKTFKYPTTGDALKVEFTLYNTTRKNAWKTNYRFLLLFALRNLPFRLELFSFVPPLLYDITIPGIKRMPISALSQMTITPVGTMRVLEMDNFVAAKFDENNYNAKIQVTVPEAWQVQLKFQSLIGPSANLLLAPILGPLGIKPSSEIGIPSGMNALEKEAAMQLVANTEEGQLHNKCHNVKQSIKLEKVWKDFELLKLLGASHVFTFEIRQGFDRTEPNIASLENILKTFGYKAEYNKNGELSYDSIVKVCDILIENGYALPNPKWHNGLSAYDKVLRDKDGEPSRAGTHPKLLDSETTNRYIYEVYEGNSYIDEEECIIRHASESLSCAESYYYHYYAYIKPNGAPLTKTDIEWAFEEGTTLNAIENTIEYYWNLQNEPPEWYYNADQRVEQLSEINNYNSTAESLEKNTKKDTSSKQTPICDDLIQQTLANN